MNFSSKSACAENHGPAETDMKDIWESVSVSCHIQDETDHSIKCHAAWEFPGSQVHERDGP
jgi:hypothetical protein